MGWSASPCWPGMHGRTSGGDRAGVSRLALFASIRIARLRRSAAGRPLWSKLARPRACRCGLQQSTCCTRRSIRSSHAAASVLCREPRVPADSTAAALACSRRPRRHGPSMRTPLHSYAPLERNLPECRAESAAVGPFVAGLGHRGDRRIDLGIGRPRTDARSMAEEERIDGEDAGVEVSMAR